MGNFTVSELLTIAVIILIVFGPNRLPELARRAGQFVAMARKAIQSLRDEIDTDYQEIAGPVRDVREELREVRRELNKSMSELNEQVRDLDAPAADRKALPAPGERAGETDEDRDTDLPADTSAEVIRAKALGDRKPGVQAPLDVDASSDVEPPLEKQPNTESEGV
ncbi:MAG TPA: twin-arginine translocase TatA/TatE family subunit [Acidimicrobiia bacterium]